MFSVNRSALVVTAKQPLVDWVNAVEPKSPVTLHDAQDEPTIYLIPECDSPQDVPRAVRQFYQKIFEHALAEWYVDEETWPQDLSLKLFHQWFDVKYHSVLLDLAKDALIREDY